MIEPKTIKIDELSFYLQPLRPLKAIRLDKQILTLLLPALGGLKDLSLDSNVDLGVLSKGVSDALQAMDGDDFEKFIIELFTSAQFMENGQPPQDLTDGVVNRIFSGKLFSIYKLVFEIMKFNKFTPFELVGDGNLMSKIGISVNPKKKMKKFGSKLAGSGNLLDT